MMATATVSSAGPRYAPKDPTLPKPWKGLVDGKNVYLYFWNPETNVTQYEKLAASSHAGSAPPQKLSSAPVSSSVQVEQSSHGHCDSIFNNDDDGYNGGSNSGSKLDTGTRSYQNAVLALDSSALDIDLVENLIKFCPAKEEMTMLKNSNNGTNDVVGRLKNPKPEQHSGNEESANLCQLIAKKMLELLDFDKDLFHLGATSKIQLKSLAEEMQAVSKGLEKVEQELTASKNDGAISVGFQKGRSADSLS
ncbi:DEAD-box ATP-dependent RNA helicase 46 [Camellia lanceoleosa]|uniref:DEAD-box ATP-dependent RNA helicase 46 n=1 Tax=Camellia lanceoleosa TaxID=1840588 RepID=A0ACC0G9M5_9ERIC|nr:DEAD-box ATP-dependent RNA helicase 46 [Camellia lanceoleosa]